MKTSHIEILAPAGHFDTLITAIKAGCDAVFFGIQGMNMRQTAALNFKLEDLKEIAKICKENKIKSYLALNTIMYNNELGLMRKILDEVKGAGIDAIIVADMAAIVYARQIGIEVHISTQLSISNTETVKFYSQFADRVVLARELSLEQVKQICTEIKKQNIRGPKGELVEVEVFAHGALCVAVSGRCAMSLYCYNSSANRGRCTQICRRPYKVTDLESGNELIIDNNYVMSASDLCTIGMLDELVESGVSVLKFEGRGRGVEYVKVVIETYKQALKSIEKGEYTVENIRIWNEELKTVFNRGQTQGFYMGRKMDEWSGVHGSKATKEKIQIGVVEKYYPRTKIAQVKILAKDEIKKGEEFFIIGARTGMYKDKLNEMWVEDKPAEILHQGDVVTFRVNEVVKTNDKFFVWRDR